jgi:hypothetical protein
VSLGHSAGWRQMVSYASFYLRQGPHQRSVAQVEAELAARYEREPPEEIASAVARGQESAAAAAAWEEGLGPQGQPLLAGGFGANDPVEVMFRVEWVNQATGESEWREFSVHATGAWTEQELFESLEETIEDSEEGYGEGSGGIASVQIMSAF